MRVIFQNISIEKESRMIVVEAFAITLTKTPITSEKLIQFNLESRYLERYLQDNELDVIKDFSQVETDYYARMLHEASKAIMAIALEVDDFERQFAKTTLVSQDEILEKVTLLMQRPKKEAKEFEERYCGVVYRELDRLETFGLRQMDSVTSRQSLSIAYITLQASKTESLQARHLDEANEAFNLHKSKYTKGEKLNSSIDMVLARSKRLIVRGDAGSGKSTLLQWIAIRSAQRNFPDELISLNNTVPFFIRLREHVKTGFPNPEDFPAQVARMITGDMPPTWVHDQLDSGRAIVLIDGVDELPRNRRTEMLESLRQLVIAYPYARYIVTSRPTAINAEEWPEWHLWVEQEGFSETTLQPMTILQIEAFIEHWYKALNKTIVDEKERSEIQYYPRDLKQLLRQRAPLRRLATTPILCAMICALYRERQQSLPSERIELYQGCVEMLLTRRDEGRKINRGEDYPTLSYSQMLALIQNFAYWLLQNDYSDVEIREADERFEQWLENINFETTGQEVRRLFVERTALLREPVVGRIDFTHRTFQEYLGAQAAIKEGDIGVLIKNARNDLWRETIILAVGEARPREREKFLLRLLKRGDDLTKRESKYQIYMLAIACLETAIELAPNVRDQVLEKAKDIIPPWSVDEIKLIAAAGDPIVSLLAWNEEYSSSRAARCIDALAMIGSKKALEVLSGYLHDKRGKVQSSLVNAWGNFDVEQFASAIFKDMNELTVNELTEILRLEDPFQSLGGVSRLNLTLNTFKDKLDDISILEQLPNFTDFTLIGVSLKDLSGLPKLLNLSWLGLAGHQLNGVSELANFPNLSSLIIISDQLRNINGLKKLSRLIRLNLICKRLNDLSVLEQLPRLTEVSLHSDKLSDISVLEHLPKLTELTLKSNKLNDISVLERLPQLTELLFANDELSDISVLEHLTKLTKLTLSSNKLSDISVIEHLTKLTEITLNSDELSDVSVLGKLPRLKSVSLHYERLIDFNIKGQLPDLTELNLHSNQLTDISILAKFPNLTRLRLTSNQLVDINPLAHLGNLSHLEINSNHLVDISVLSELPELKDLTIHSQKLNDLTVLELLPNLTDLQLWGKQFSDQNILRTLPVSIDIDLILLE